MYRVPGDNCIWMQSLVSGLRVQASGLSGLSRQFLPHDQDMMNDAKKSKDSLSTANLNTGPINMRASRGSECSPSTQQRCKRLVKLIYNPLLRVPIENFLRLKCQPFGFMQKFSGSPSTDIKTPHAIPTVEQELCAVRSISKISLKE